MRRSVLIVAALVVGCSGEPVPSVDGGSRGDGGMPRDAGADVVARPDAALPLGCGLSITLTPAPRVQLAMWIERADETSFRTVALTSSVAYRGIGNRPGALQMNSGFRWPYGRREGVLPIWAHRRATSGGLLFPRVIHQARPEGFASRVTDDSSLEAHFCLSFVMELSRRSELDAVSCASPLFDDKGRYLTEADVRAAYAEPAEEPVGIGVMRALPLSSLYPPRRDLTTHAPVDHPDSQRYATDAFAAMPELDAVTMATPPGELPLSRTIEVPDAGVSYVLWVEVSSEGDYDATGRPARATPRNPELEWDYWAREYGYPYLGQPSVVFRVPFVIDRDAAGTWDVSDAAGYSELQGLDGTLRPIDGTIVNDPIGAPGSGVDRLHVQPDGSRVRLDFEPCP